MTSEQIYGTIALKKGGNMRFVHIADMHFDAPFVVLNSRTNLGEIRRMEQRKALKKVINYIKENKLKH